MHHMLLTAHHWLNPIMLHVPAWWSLLTHA